MKNLHIVIVSSILIIGIAGCGQKQNQNDQTYLLQSATWYQHSAEMTALYYQSFNWASSIVKEKARQTRDKPAAVVLDIDETVLNNSPSTGFQILENRPFSDALWDSWCALAEAEPLPGVLEFTKTARQSGVEVFYISNRKVHLMSVTIENLEKYGFPNADSTHILLKRDTSSKDGRRELVSRDYDIILFIGDNLGDFDGSFDRRTNQIANKLVHDRYDQFGTKYIILPNPMYGAWEKPFRSDEESPVKTRRSALKSFLPQNE